MTIDTQMEIKLNAKLATSADKAISLADSIPAERREALENIANYVSSHIDTAGSAKLTFICTHNSRRSQMAQIWAQVAAAHYGVDNFTTYSGGTKATAFNPRAVSAMGKAGFRIVQNDTTGNPIYMLTYAANTPPLKAFSKKYDDPANPQDRFGAVMTCSQADEACPVVNGAEFRQSIPYEDPKSADGTPQEQTRYDECCLQIATEMFYLFSKVG